MQPFPQDVLELWVLSRRRRRPKLRIVLELWILSRRRRRPFPHALLELWVLWVLSKRRKAAFLPCSPGALGLEGLEQEDESLMYESLEQASACLK
jgi:hypothetical protein